jgi:multidrug efflux system membrane fusion protein
VAVQTVVVRPQVGGLLRTVRFREGQEVARGDVLFEIDPRPYQQALARSEAMLAKDSALSAQAAEDEKKAEGLVGKGVAAKEQLDVARANALALESQVKADTAQVEADQLNLSNCTILSPISGRTGDVMTDVGNVVQAGSTPLVTINQMAPIDVSFSLPEKDLPDVKRYSQGKPLAVQAAIPGSDAAPLAGRLVFIDNAVDSATGTFLLKAAFDNRDRSLWPGQYVNVVLTLTVQEDATVVPAQALQSGQNGQFVFVVKQDKTVESRPVSVALTYDGGVAISQGLSPGEVVVTDGQLLLVPGARVSVKGGPAGEAAGKSAPQGGAGSAQKGAQ